MRSMTGYGHAQRSVDAVELTLSIKTVNSRYFDFKARLPRELVSMEAEIKRRIQSQLQRGRVDLYVELGSSSGEYELNDAVVDNYMALADKLSARGIPGTIDLSALLTLPGMMSPRRSDLTSDAVAEALLEALDECLTQVVEARETEGRAIRAQLQERIERLRDEVERISRHTGQVKAFFESKLRERVEEVVNGTPLDESRLAQEVLYYCEKADISEEVSRLRAHLDRFASFLTGGSRGSIGKNLDFLCQEIHREVNTILSKSARAQISEIGVESKAEIEKIREQVQNVE